MTPEREQALRTLTEAWLGLRQAVPKGDDVIVERTETFAGAVRGCSTSWRG